MVKFRATLSPKHHQENVLTRFSDFKIQNTLNFYLKFQSTIFNILRFEVGRFDDFPLHQKFTKCTE